MKKTILLFLLFIIACDQKNEYHKGISLLWENKKINWNATSLKVSGSFIYGHTIDDSIFKLNINNGKVVWKKQSTGSYSKSRPLLIGNKICVGGKESLKSYDLEGNLLWSQTTNCKTDNLINSGYLLINSRTDLGLFANNLKDGKLVWKIQPKYQMLSTTKPTIKDSLLLISNLGYTDKVGSTFSCINIKNRKIIWEIPNGNFLDSEAVTDEKYVYYNSDSSYIRGFTHKINLITGKEIWKIKTNPETFIKPTLNKNNIIINSYKNGVMYINATNGKVIWSVNNPNYISETEFLLHKNIIYFGTENRKLIGITMNGKIILETEFEYGIGNPFVYKNHVYVNDGNGKLFKITPFKNN